MKGVLTLTVCLAVLASSLASADGRPAAGKLLVATEDVDGSSFERSVILLLHYDEAGAQGLVVNRRSDADLAQVFPDSEMLANYQGTLFWGGPVRMLTMRALLRTDQPPADAVEIIAGVYQVPLDDDLDTYLSDDSTLRFYAGYAGWSPGQLDQEIRFGSWKVVTASADLVFAVEPDSVWRLLRPLQEFRARHVPDPGISRMPVAETCAANTGAQPLRQRRHPRHWSPCGIDRGTSRPPAGGQFPRAAGPQPAAR